jgi:hypothetical protein
VIAFVDRFLLKRTFMANRGSAFFTAKQRTVSGLAILFLLVAAFFSFLNSQRMKVLRANTANAIAARDAAERREAHEKLNAAAGGTTGAEEPATKVEAELAQVQKEKADLQAKLDANQQEMASLQKRVGEAPSADLQAQVDDLRRQLDSAEKEKTFLAQKIQDAQEHASEPKETKKRRENTVAHREISSGNRTGVRGTVLAYNQAYNFVVLNLGARNGVETNSEMLVLRDGTLIGKIRISSVEPATAIGDIITNSLERGVQVQPGDTVIYAGTSP